jgi:cell fate regulator YaaT (PSP1 superfamily)
MSYVGLFDTTDEKLARFDRVVVRSERGTELGTVLVTPRPIVPNLQLSGQVLRRMNPKDQEQVEHIDRRLRPEALAFCREQVGKLMLPMKVVEVDHLFGGERVVFYFISETRVDFRELVRILTGRFHLRVELRQIGARDCTRLSGGCGSCGRQLCCATWKKDLGGITYEMAKAQFDNPEQQKLIGVCGKLKCCLKYEYADYLEAMRVLPEIGTRLATSRGTGIVIGRNLTLRMIQMRMETGEKLSMGIDELRPPSAAAPPAPEPPPAQEPPPAPPEPPATQ